MLAEMLEKDAKPVTVLYITPLRALNRDILERIKWWGENLEFKVDVRHGDTTKYARSKQAREPPHILITTPESLQAILPAERMGKHLENVRFVIIDEIHELAAEKRGYQLSVALERLHKKIGHEFQRIGISATVGSPETVAQFLAGVGRQAEIVDVSTEKEYRVRVFYPTAEEGSEKLGLPPEIYARAKKLKEIVDAHKQVITFVNTRNMAEQLSLYFSAIHDGTDVHHSSLSKDVRLNVEKTFKEGDVKHLIATSSMELGIDVGEVDAVVQYGSPRQVSRFIQRVGRSGHRWDLPSTGYIIALDPIDFVEAA
ncbi:MAG TPA: DEAD/DEAH box helicase, partial [Pyrodictiaceae archaeon]|nr:DEAD/DEAH box helicase [Pyrodictiaceae archaeon]